MEACARAPRAWLSTKCKCGPSLYLTPCRPLPPYAQGDWAHVTDADVLAGAYDNDATPPPEDSPRTSRSSASNTSPSRLLSARQG